MNCVTCGYWQATIDDQCESCATPAPARVTLVGTLRRHTYARPRRGRDLLANLIADIVAPLAGFEIWTVEVLDPTSRRRNDNGDPYRFYRTRSGRLPKALDPAMQDQPVTIKATIERWNNGLGGYLSNVKVTP